VVGAGTVALGTGVVVGVGVVGDGPELGETVGVGDVELGEPPDVEVPEGTPLDVVPNGEPAGVDLPFDADPDVAPPNEVPLGAVPLDDLLAGDEPPTRGPSEFVDDVRIDEDRGPVEPVVADCLEPDDVYGAPDVPGTGVPGVKLDSLELVEPLAAVTLADVAAFAALVRFAK
jgi:hypothetical protein